MAVTAGAGGVLGGRAFWKEYWQIDQIVQRAAKPLYARYGLTLDELHSIRVTENWHFRYSERRAAATAPAAIAEGDVY